MTSAGDRADPVASRADELESALSDGDRALQTDGDLHASRRNFEPAYHLAVIWYPSWRRSASGPTRTASAAPTRSWIRIRHGQITIAISPDSLRTGMRAATGSQPMTIPDVAAEAIVKTLEGAPVTLHGPELRAIRRDTPDLESQGHAGEDEPEDSAPQLSRHGARCGC